MCISDEAIVIWVFSGLGLYLYVELFDECVSQLRNGTTPANRVANIFIICYGVVLSFVSLSTLFSYVRRKLSKPVSQCSGNYLDDLEGVEVLLLVSEVIYFLCGSILAIAVGALWDLTSIEERTSEVNRKIASCISVITLYVGILAFIGISCYYWCQRIKGNVIARTTSSDASIEDQSCSPLLP